MQYMVVVPACQPWQLGRPPLLTYEEMAAEVESKNGMLACCPV